VVPAFANGSHAFGELASLTNQYIDRLDGWRTAVTSRQTAPRVNGADLMTALVGKREDQVQEFERAVAQTYEAIALRARVLVLEKIAAESSNPDRSLPHVERALRDGLSALAERQSQLAGLLDDLSAMQIDGSKLPVSFAGKRSIEVRSSFGRLARALHSTPDAIPLLTQSDQTVLELDAGAAGLSVVTPRSV